MLPNRVLQLLLVMLVFLFFNADMTQGQEPVVRNSIDMEFVLIPAGRFIMGSPPDEPYRSKGEIQHEVFISKPFYMQTSEVTVQQWQKVMGKRWYHFFRWHKGAQDLPVTRTCYYDIREFIEKLNALGEGTYSLPTEAQWEYSARAGSTMAFSWGDRIDCSRAMYANNNRGVDDCLEKARSRGLPVDSPSPVKSFPPNAWGLYDMHGNVWEWCRDWFGPYTAAAETDPGGPASGDMRVRRGGGWFGAKDTLRSANRAYGHPASRLNTTGFRVIRLAE